MVVFFFGTALVVFGRCTRSIDVMIARFCGAELLQEALAASDNSATNGLTVSGLAALFAEAWFPSLTPGYGAAG